MGVPNLHAALHRGSTTPGTAEERDQVRRAKLDAETVAAFFCGLLDRAPAMSEETAGIVTQSWIRQRWS